MKIIATNKKAHYRYLINETYECGIVLSGPEVKSLRNNQIDLSNSYVNFKNQEAFIINANIAHYKFDTNKEYNPSATRKLLLKKTEINRIMGKKDEKKLQVIPIKIYWLKNKVKIEIGLGKPKNNVNRKEEIKQRDIDLEIRKKFKLM